MNRSTLALAVALVALSGCGARSGPPPATPSPTPAPAAAPAPTPPVDASAPAPARPEKVIELDPLRIQVVTDASGQRRLIHYDPRMLLDQGNDELSAGRFDQALERYDKLVDEFPDSDLVVAAHYNAGLALEGKRDFDAAIVRYRAVVDRQPAGRDAVDALVQIGVVLSELHRWADAQKVFEELLGRSDLTPDDQIECKARLGYVLVEQKSYARAESILEEALAYFENVAKTTQLDSNFYVAMCNYYLADIPRRQARAIELRVTGPAGDQQLRADIVAKRELVKLAYDRYLIALRRRNAYWATAAGYQMSQLFKDFWDDLVRAPVPPNLDQREAGFYNQEVHKQSRELLTKALDGHTKNVELAEAYKTSTEWSEASRIRASEIAQILARESAGELVVPPPETPLARAAPGATIGGPDYLPGRVEL